MKYYTEYRIIANDDIDYIRKHILSLDDRLDSHLRNTLLKVFSQSAKISQFDEVAKIIIEIGKILETKRIRLEFNTKDVIHLDPWIRDILNLQENDLTMNNEPKYTIIHSYDIRYIEELIDRLDGRIDSHLEKTIQGAFSKSANISQTKDVAEKLNEVLDILESRGIIR